MLPWAQAPAYIRLTDIDDIPADLISTIIVQLGEIRRVFKSVCLCEMACLCVYGAGHGDAAG